MNGKVAVITANLGKFDRTVPYVKQSVGYDFYMFTDENFLPRNCSMTPRLQARIVKTFGWQMAPGYDIYIWVDSSYSLQHQDSVKWFVEQCEGVDLAVLKHPMRNTIREEADYLEKRLTQEKAKKKDPYVIKRYENELINDQLIEIEREKDFVDNHLFASTAFVYQNNERVRGMMKDWWYHISRYHSIDQLSLPYVIWKHGCSVRVIPTQHHHDFKIPYLTLTRYL
jgi:hypothetical protein